MRKLGREGPRAISSGANLWPGAAPPFLYALILEEVQVLCFDRILYVLILNAIAEQDELGGAQEWNSGAKARHFVLVSQGNVS